jgi:formylglycine-generating enzyme required for sulfatase activity
MRHWNEVTESKANPSLHPQLIRLPLDTEWTIAAGGEASENRFPWDMAKKTTRDIKEIVKRANISESGIGHTTPVNAYLRGASPHAIMDMAGNVWEWQANYRNLKEGWLGLRGGSWLHHVVSARVAIRYYRHPGGTNISFGFRVWARPSG